MKESEVCIYTANQNLRGYSLILGTRVANGYMYSKLVMFSYPVPQGIIMV